MIFFESAYLLSSYCTFLLVLSTYFPFTLFHLRPSTSAVDFEDELRWNWLSSQMVVLGDMYSTYSRLIPSVFPSWLDSGYFSITSRQSFIDLCTILLTVTAWKCPSQTHRTQSKANNLTPTWISDPCFIFSSFKLWRKLLGEHPSYISHEARSPLIPPLFNLSSDTIFSPRHCHHHYSLSCHTELPAPPSTSRGEFRGIGTLFIRKDAFITKLLWKLGPFTFQSNKWKKISVVCLVMYKFY